MSPRSAVHALLLLIAVAAPVSAQTDNHMPNPAQGILEVRSYNLEPGTRDTFHELIIETLPMLERWNIDVVAFGPSAHDSTSYFLARAFPSLTERQDLEDAFYGSAEWRDGPRARVLALIENYTTVVLALDTDTIESLRQQLRK